MPIPHLTGPTDLDGFLVDLTTEALNRVLIEQDLGQRGSSAPLMPPHMSLGAQVASSLIEGGFDGTGRPRCVGHGCARATARLGENPQPVGFEGIERFSGGRRMAVSALSSRSAEPRSFRRPLADCFDETRAAYPGVHRGDRTPRSKAAAKGARHGGVYQRRCAMSGGARPSSAWRASSIAHLGTGAPDPAQGQDAAIELALGGQEADRRHGRRQLSLRRRWRAQWLPKCAVEPAVVSFG